MPKLRIIPVPFEDTLVVDEETGEVVASGRGSELLIALRAKYGDEETTRLLAGSEISPASQMDSIFGVAFFVSEKGKPLRRVDPKDWPEKET